MFELMFALLAAGGAWTVTAVATGSILKRKLLSERDFHILAEGDQVKLVDGPRRKALKLEQAENQLALISGYSKRLGWRWPSTLWTLYGSKRASRSLTELEQVKQIAVSSQRKELLVEAVRAGFEEHRIMSVIASVSKDEHFKQLRAMLNTKDSLDIPLQVLEAQARASEDVNIEVVVLELTGAKRPLKKASQLAAQNENRLPAGYAFDYGWKDRGKSFESFVVKLRDPAGKLVREEDFYTSVYKTEEEQKRQINKLKRQLLVSARHHSDPEGTLARIA